MFAEVWTVDQRFVGADVNVVMGAKRAPRGSETRLVMLIPAGLEL